MSSTAVRADDGFSEAAPLPARPFFGRVESLRGVGAVAVAAYHLSGWAVYDVMLLPHQPWSGIGPIQNTAGRLALDLIPGHAALMMFFVISGLVLRVSLQYGPQDSAPAAVRFVVARIFRIYPIVIFDVLVVCLLNGWQLPASPLRPAAPVDMSMLIGNFLLLDVSVNPTLWALQVEVLMVPAILALYFVERSHGPLPILAFVVVATVLSFSKQWLFFPPLSRNLFAFALGMLIPTLGRDLVRPLTKGAAARWLAAATAVLVLAGPFVLGFYSQFSAVIEAYAAAALLSLVTYRSDLGAFLRWLDGRALRRLGTSSGSYYVLHPVLLPAAAVAALMIPPAWSLSAPLAVGILVIGAWAVAIAPLMWLSYCLIEAPGIALGRVVIARLLPHRVVGQAGSNKAVIAEPVSLP